ncbi:phage major tail tube protein [Terrimonas sp. NA20]|uniref:Phage major tail tube protein n=1 Tax=Terrimonas ginsenosidimutans TaxID=2908004 RepID=A0ABS9KRK1_9BACT|nr:phage major tail tube protein [Terrimonas ginsenosidimutans]MCG2614895.1 phage major tail tube protein [Terrimonas ginsenosidimutans]
MDVKVNRVTNAAVYVDGQGFIGRAEEVTCPDIAPVMVDHKGLGMIGQLELPAGLQKMSSKIKWNAPYLEVMKKTHNVFQSMRLQVRSSIETYENGNRIAEAPVVIYMTAIPKKAGGFVFKAQDNVEREDEFNVTSYKLEVAGIEIIYVDVMANIWRVNGNDQLATYRANLGMI